MKRSDYEGLQNEVRQKKILPELEVVKNIYSESKFIIRLKSDEFNTICPKTGLPDFAELIIEYIPDKFLLEQKSLKFYLNAYRNMGIFQENATNKVFEDFIKIVKPGWAKIVTNWKSRGGITIQVEREYTKR